VGPDGCRVTAPLFCGGSGTRRGAPKPWRLRGPEGIHHHLPAGAGFLRSALLPGGGGVRGSRMRDRKPPSFVAGGSAVSARTTIFTGRAILMALCPLRSSSVVLTWYRWYCWFSSTRVPLYCNFLLLLRRPRRVTPSDSQPRRPSCTFPGLEPHCPDLPARAPQSDAFAEIPHPATAGTAQLNFTCWYCTHRGTADRWPLITAGHQARPPVPSPSCTNLGFRTPQPCRPANFSTQPASSSLPGTA